MRNVFTKFNNTPAAWEQLTKYLYENNRFDDIKALYNHGKVPNSIMLDLALYHQDIRHLNNEQIAYIRNCNYSAVTLTAKTDRGRITKHNSVTPEFMKLLEEASL